MRRLSIWFEQTRVGDLDQDDNGSLSFRYDSDFEVDANASAISVSLPKRPTPFSQKECLPFFDGLLPESLQRQAAAKAVGVSENNTFALLNRLGGEVAGALKFLPPGETPKPLDAPWTPTPLDDPGLAEVLAELPIRPMLAGTKGLRLSLAGVQSKLPVCLVKGQVCLPGPDQPTTHILKPALTGLEASTENEAFAMTLAAELGLHAAPVELRAIETPKGRTTFLLVERYDRVWEGGALRRLHQEDFCQALAVPSLWKYQSEGGPNLQSCFGLVRQMSALPSVDLMSLLDAVIFNVIVGNADAHGKNFSFLYTRDGLRLAPFYDLMSTVFYPKLLDSFAMKIGDQSAFDRLGIRAWQGFAKQAVLSFPFVRARITDFAKRTPGACEATLARLGGRDFDDTALRRLMDIAVERANRCAKKILLADEA
jgi:serine/threonine-protein kinase HipA